MLTSVNSYVNVNITWFVVFCEPYNCGIAPRSFCAPTDGLNCNISAKLF